MARSRRHPRLLATAARWPLGLLLTWWSYLWRITPLHRRERPGALPGDGPPPLPGAVSLEQVRGPDTGSGAYLHRRYRVDLREPELDATALIARVREDPNRVVPGGLARFHKVAGSDDRPLAVGDEYAIRMPGPWDGPVRVVEVGPSSFRFATLDGHLEAGQIAWRAVDLPDGLRFEVESWSRPADALSRFAHHHLRMAKEVQLHMWTSVLERVARLAGGRMADGIDIETAVIDGPVERSSPS